MCCIILSVAIICGPIRPSSSMYFLISKEKVLISTLSEMLSLYALCLTSAESDCAFNTSPLIS